MSEVKSPWRTGRMAAQGASNTASRPNNVGILAMELYFPGTFVEQTELEQFDGVSAGKYTIGLGQSRMGFCSDREDIASISMTAVNNLMEKYGVGYDEIGRLEVGTETLIDKSKSVKTCVMSLFEASGNHSVEGVTSVNGCYGGTAALFNSVAWVESSDWDGRYALVVCADVAVYAEGNARPTGGAGSVAMLVGPGAPVTFDRGVRATHCEESWDFYKPKMSSEFPVVDGALSQRCYLSAVDKCVNRYIENFERQTSRPFFPLGADYYVFHSPYVKLVQKAFNRIAFAEFQRGPTSPLFTVPGMAERLAPFEGMDVADTLASREFDMVFRDVSAEQYEQKVTKSLHCTKNIGNIYTGAVYGNLLALITEQGSGLVGKRAVCFSYGSGLIASMFSFTFTADPSYMADRADVFSRLERRIKKTPEEFVAILKLREDLYGRAGVTPAGSVADLPPGTWYLDSIDDKFRRSYLRTPLL